VTEGTNIAELSLFQRLCLFMAGALGIGASSAQPVRAALVAMLRARHAEAMRRFAVVARKFFRGPAEASARRGRPAFLDLRPARDSASVTAPAQGQAEASIPDKLYSLLLPEEATTYSRYLRELLEHDPDLRALLAASPRARMLLRRLMRVQGDYAVPDCLRPPPRPARPAELPPPAALPMPTGGPAPAGEPAPAGGPAAGGARNRGAAAHHASPPVSVAKIPHPPRPHLPRPGHARAPPARPAPPNRPRHEPACCRQRLRTPI
jgi:hypothetical protein